MNAIGKATIKAVLISMIEPQFINQNIEQHLKDTNISWKLCVSNGIITKVESNLYYKDPRIKDISFDMTPNNDYMFYISIKGPYDFKHYKTYLTLDDKSNVTLKELVKIINHLMQGYIGSVCGKELDDNINIYFKEFKFTQNGIFVNTERKN